MNIVLVTREEFPYGSAASNRVLTYMPGIVALGHKVTILCLFMSREENMALLDERGECSGRGCLFAVCVATGSRGWGCVPLDGRGVYAVVETYRQVAWI